MYLFRLLCSIISLRKESHFIEFCIIAWNIVPDTQEVISKCFWNESSWSKETQ